MPISNFGLSFPKQEGEPLTIREKSLQQKHDAGNQILQIEVIVKRKHSTTKILRRVLKWLRKNGWE